MKTVKWTLEVFLSVPDITGEVEVEDDASEADIEAAVREAMWERLTLTWEAEG